MAAYGYKKLFTIVSKTKFAIFNRLYQVHRTYLSDAFRFKEAWNKRLQSPILQKINIDDLYYELDRKLQAEQRVSAIDIDIFANAVTTVNHTEELEELVHRFRLTEETRNTLPSTHHAVVRCFLELNLWDSLVDMLSDPLNYGLFPDDCCNILLMDTFLENKDYEKAARIATLMMLQEDFGSEMSKKLALLSCFHYLKNPECWTLKTEEAQPDDTEEVKVRVRYLRNPYFDDHFDLREPRLLVGKTLALLGREEGGSLGRTAEIVGWAMYEKWERAKTALKGVKPQNEKVLAEGVALCKEYIKDDCEVKEELYSLLNDLDKSGNVQRDGSLIEMATEHVKAAIAKHETEMLANQTQQLSVWEQKRKDLLQEQFELVKRQTVSEEIQKKKRELEEKEEVLFFFENKEQIALRHPEPKPAKKEEGGKKKKSPVESNENYIPPEVRKGFVQAS